jgi:hypothetical protein
VALVLAGLLLAALLLGGGCQRRAPAAVPLRLEPTPPGGRLQEVAPPPAVQQLEAGLATHEPQLVIEAPADGSNLPSGNWNLRLRVRDWPLVDGGPLGLGPHLAVQIDDHPLLRLTQHHSTPTGDVLETRLPPLGAGSHRITAYAAQPWGEAVKTPGAAARIRVQSVAANPLALPAPGTPELLAVSPDGWSGGEPVLLDWLLFDAPLQRLREDDASWRLRVSVNGDSFLMDQNLPVWLRGWRSGSNALRLELLDGRGEPLNPPYNSLVREVTVGGGPGPRWQDGPLAAGDLAVLLGEAPPPLPEPLPEPLAAPLPEPLAEPLADRRPPPDLQAEPAAPAPAPAPVQPAARPAATDGAPQPAAPPSPDADTTGGSAPAPAPKAPTTVAPQPQPPGAAPEPGSNPPPRQASEAEADPLPPSTPDPQAAAAAPTPQPGAAERVAPSSAIGGAARDLVAADGSLIQRLPRGPLAGLRQRLAGS